MNRIFVLSQQGNPLMPCSPARARKLLALKKAMVYKRYPFTIKLVGLNEGNVQPLELKYDPGSKETGVGIVLHGKKRNIAIFVAILTHRGQEIKDGLESRRATRRSRRHRKTRYRKARFLNRSRKAGWLPPSVQSRVDNIAEWTKRFIKLSPVSFISVEQVKFDTQKMNNAVIEGKEYQRGTLFEYEVKQYLLEKYQYQCVYCQKKNVPFEKEHVVPKSRGGSNRISNLVLSCRECNQKKDNLTIEEYLKNKPVLLRKIKSQMKAPMKDVASVNSTRLILPEELRKTGLPVLTGTGAETSYNRINQGYEKQHYIDALCVGETGKNIYLPKGIKPLLIKKEKRNSRQMCLVDKYGFPRSKAKGSKIVKGFKTGDIVKAVVLKGKKKGVYIGKVSVRSSGRFNIKIKTGRIESVNWKCCCLLHKFDGYSYNA